MGYIMYVNADAYDPTFVEGATKHSRVEQGREFVIDETVTKKSTAPETATKKTGVKGAFDAFTSLNEEYVILFFQIVCLIDFFICCYIGDHCTGWLFGLATQSYELDILVLLILRFCSFKRFFFDGEMSLCGLISVLITAFFALMVIASAIVVVGIIYCVICLFEGFGMPYFYYFY